MRNVNYVNGVNGVVAGGVATVDVPVGVRYHALKAFLAATVSGSPSTDPTEILDYSRLIADGVVIRDLPPSYILKIAALNGITPATGELPSYFSEPWRASVTGEEATSWPMYYTRKLTLEMKFKSTAVAPSCVVMVSYDYAKNVSDGKEFASIVKQLTYANTVPSGNFDFTTLPKTFPIQRIHLLVSTGSVTSIEVYRNNEKVREGTAAQNSAFLKDYGIDASQFSYPIVFDFEQQISSPLIVQPADSFNVRVNSSAGNTLTALVENRAPGFI